jgi:hypothetical protein
VITNKLGSVILVGVCVMVPVRVRAADVECPVFAPPVIELRVDPPDDRIDTTKSLEQMRRAAGKVRHAAPLVGAYLGALQYGIQIDDTVRQTAAGVFCVTPKYVTLKLVLERIVYIPREFTGDSCLAALARDHEAKHADAEAKALDTVRPALETAVREAVHRAATIPGSSRASALATLTAEIQSGVNHVLDDMATVRKQLDAKVDDPDEIARLKTECGGAARAISRRAFN